MTIQKNRIKTHIFAPKDYILLTVNELYFIFIWFDQWYKEDQTQILPTYGVFFYIFNYYYIMLRMHKKTTILSY